MSFLDELKNAQNQKQQEETHQFNRDWETLVESFINYIKDVCRYVAASGRTQCTIYLQDYIKYIEEEHTSQYVDSCDSDKIVEIEFHNTTEGMMWMRLRNKFYHYICEERQAYSIPYPNTVGMSKKNADNLSNKVKEKIESEGLTVKVVLKREFPRVHYEDRCEIIDEQMYVFLIDITW